MHVDQLGGCLGEVSILRHRVFGLWVGREVPSPVGTLLRHQIVLPQVLLKVLEFDILSFSIFVDTIKELAQGRVPEVELRIGFVMSLIQRAVNLVDDDV